jgi:hypothetical protein
MREQIDNPYPSTDELDDVEGHGLREVAAAAGIGAAVLGAGGGAVAATAGHGPGPAPMLLKPPTIVSQTQDDANQLVTDAVRGVGGVANQTLNDTEALTGHTLAQVNSITAPVVTVATNTAQSAHDLATTTAGDATTLAGHEVTAATVIVSQTERSALDTVASTERTAFTLADSTLKTATREVSSVESTAISVVTATENKVGQGWTLDLSIVGERVSTGGNVLSPSGTATVFDSTGKALASAKVVNGAATLSFDAAGHSGSYTIHYAGSTPSATISWLSPTL